MKWKVTRNGEDLYPGDTGLPKRGAMRQAQMFNRWAKANGGKATYGIKPLKEGKGK